MLNLVFIVATMFLEFWKRKQAEIAYEWDLLAFEDEEVCTFGFSMDSLCNLARFNRWLRLKCALFDNSPVWPNEALRFVLLGYMVTL